MPFVTNNDAKSYAPQSIPETEFCSFHSHAIVLIIPERGRAPDPERDETPVRRTGVTKPSSPFPAVAANRAYGRYMSRKRWTFLSNHGHVLVCLADNPDMLLKNVAVNVGITERSVQQIVSDLEGAHVITRHRDGRRNHYEVRREVRFRHSLEAGLRVGDFVDLARRRPRLRMTDAAPRLAPVPIPMPTPVRERERDVQ